MTHRHLRADVGLTLAALDDILEHGGPEDWVRVRRAIDAEPFGDVADRVVKICRQHETYGTSNLWLYYVAHKRDASHRGPERGG